MRKLKVELEKSMSGYDEFKRKNDIDRRKHRKNQRRRRRLTSGILLLLLLGAAVFFVKEYITDDKEPSISATAESEEKEMEQEKEQNLLEEGEDARTFRRSSTKVNLSPAVSIPRRIDLSAVKPGTNHSIGASSYAYSTQKVRGWIYGGVPYDGEKVAFLTFDDGPVKMSSEVLDVLKRRDVPATFFIPGYVLEEHPDKEVLHRYIREGHAIGIHSYSHVYEKLYPGRYADKEVILEEFIATRDLMRETLGDEFDSKVFRFPGGSMSWNGIKEAQEALNELGIYDMDWNSISGDGEPISRRPDGPEAMAEHVMYTLNEYWIQDIAVVLMHDTKAITAEYLDQVIDQFIEEGYTFGILE